MATGALDANGIWQYGEDDSEPTFSGLLNKLGDSVSDKFTGGLLPVSNGGTGATTAAAAKTNLGIPFAMAAGTATPSGGDYVTVTYPSGRFSDAPIITAISSGAGSISKFGILFSNNTASSVTLQGQQIWPIHWHAIQMTSSSAAG